MLLIITQRSDKQGGCKKQCEKGRKVSLDRDGFNGFSQKGDCGRNCMELPSFLMGISSPITSRRRWTLAMNLGFVAGRGPQGCVCFLGEDFMGKNKRIKGQ